MFDTNQPKNKGMLLSLPFFFLATVLHGVCLRRAKNAKPNGRCFYSMEKHFGGAVHDFTELLDQWVAKNKNLRWYQKDKEHFIIDDQSHLLSYGLFYHFKLSPVEDGFMIEIAAESKMISGLQPKKLVQADFHNKLKTLQAS